MGEIDLISRQAAIDEVRNYYDPEDHSVVSIEDRIKALPSVQPEREIIEQLRWERDTAIQQLKDLGYGLGEKPKPDDTISRQAAINALYEKCMMPIWCKVLVEKMLKDLPSAQPERKKGKWKRTYIDHEAMGERPSIFYCSACNQCIAYPVNYCPSCGADMRGEADG